MKLVCEAIVPCNRFSTWSKYAQGDARLTRTDMIADNRVPLSCYGSVQLPCSNSSRACCRRLAMSGSLEAAIV